MANSPTQRSLAYLRKNNYHCQVVEKFNQYAMVRIDLFGFIDILAMKEGEKGLIGIQTTSTGNLSARVKKIMDLPIHKVWLNTGNKIILHGWAKRGARGKVKHWTLKEIEITE